MSRISYVRRAAISALGVVLATGLLAQPAHALANSAPSAPDWSLTVGAGTANSVDLFTGAKDPDGDSFVPTNVQATNGTLGPVDNVTGKVDYTPDEGYTGPAQLTYQLMDSHGNTSTTITVDLTVVSGSLVALDDTVTIIENGYAAITPTSNDYSANGSMDLHVLAYPSHGWILAPITGNTLVYRVNPGFTGTDTITYYDSSSGLNPSSAATITITIAPSNGTPPSGLMDTYTVQSGVSTDLPVMTNDYDADGDQISLFVYQLSSTPLHGIAVVTDPKAGIITYTPDTGYLGNDYFRYNLVDSTGMLSQSVYVGLSVQSPDFSGTDPAISGIAKVGNTLSVVPQTFTPSDGVTVSYQWLSNNKAIAGATDPTYTLTAAEAGTYMVVRATAQRAGYTMVLDSDSLLVPNANLAPPTLTGDAVAGKTLTADPGTWAGANLTLHFAWLRDGSPVAGATGDTYTLTNEDAGHQVGVRVTATRSGFADVSAASSVDAVPGVNLTRPSFSGTVTPGSRLKARRGTWAAPGYGFSYRWLRDGKTIANATGRYYRLQPADLGHRISVRVIATRVDFPRVTATSTKKVCR